MSGHCNWKALGFLNMSLIMLETRTALGSKLNSARKVLLQSFSKLSIPYLHQPSILCGRYFIEDGTAEWSSVKAEHCLVITKKVFREKVWERALHLMSSVYMLLCRRSHNNLSRSRGLRETIANNFSKKHALKIKFFAPIWLERKKVCSSSVFFRGACNIKIRFWCADTSYDVVALPMVY